MRDWPRDVYPPTGYRMCLRCPVFIPITKSIPLCHGCAREVR